MYNFIKPWLFTQDSESVHDRLMELIHRYPGLSKLHLKKTNNNHFNSKLGWKNPIGLAAGFDKNAMALDFLSQIGFGAVEVGTVTPKPQIGNDKKRILRLQQDKALINWMGFPSHGSEIVKKRLEKFRSHKNSNQSCVGVNIGKNKETPNSKAIDDYVLLYKGFLELSDYITINISSPNTPGLRELQNPIFLNELFMELKKISGDKKLSKLCVKLSPDLKKKDLESQLNVFKEFEVGAVIGTNTTIDHSYDKGGLSGTPLFKKSLSFLEKVTEQLKESETMIIGCGGISSQSEIQKLQTLGINHFQIYTSFVYQGPAIINKLLS